MTTHNPDHELPRDGDARDRAMDSALQRLLGPDGPPDLTARIVDAMAANRPPRFADASADARPTSGRPDRSEQPDERLTPTDSSPEEGDTMFDAIPGESRTSRFTWQATWLTMAAAAVLALVTAVILQPDVLRLDDDGSNPSHAQDGDSDDTAPVEGARRIVGREQRVDGNRVTVIETREVIVPYVADAALSVLATNGNITLRRDASRQDVAITLRVQASDQNAQVAGQLVDELQARITRDATSQELQVDARIDGGNGNNGQGNGQGNNGFGNGRGNGNGNNGNNGGDTSNRQISVEILLPDAKGVTAKSVNGNVTVVSLSGDATVESTNGNVTVALQSGNTSVASTNGNVSVEDVAGNVDARSVNGNVVARRVGGSATARTTNGLAECSLADASTGRFDVRSGNGAASVSVGATWNGAVQLDTKMGSATVKDPGGRVSTDGKEGGSRMGASMRVVVGAETGDESTLRSNIGGVALTVRE